MNAIAWFEIPAQDLDRAQRFYEALLAAPLRRESAGPQTELAVLPYQPGQGVGGCLMAGPGLVPAAAAGPLVYLAVGPTLDAALARLPAGGRIATPKVTLPDGMGVFAHIDDSEGNRVGLHAST